MKIVVKRLIRHEKGQAMLVALILLLVGGLFCSSLLAFMGTGLLTGEVYEKRTAELYAADAGVEDAVWKLDHGEVALCPGDPTYNYTMADVNNKSVAVDITSMGAYGGAGNLTGTYRILSTATGDGTGTKIEAYLDGSSRYGDYSGLLGHVITINDDLTEAQIKDLANELSKLELPCCANCTELCELECKGIYDYDTIPEGCEGCGVVYNYPDPNWPPPSVMSDWYLEDVQGEKATHYSGDTEIDLAGADLPLGPAYVEGGLTIHNSGGNATLTLTGTLYVTGNTKIAYNTANNNEMALDLNVQTIFVASNSTGGGHEALQVGDKCTIIGPGIIVAVGDVYFAPKGDVGSLTEPVFLFSVSVTAQLQPSNNWYGAIAGSVDVQVQPGKTPSLTYPPGGFGTLNFPGMTQPRLFYSIASWEATPL